MNIWLLVLFVSLCLLDGGVDVGVESCPNYFCEYCDRSKMDYSWLRPINLYIFENLVFICLNSGGSGAVTSCCSTRASGICYYLSGEFKR